MKNLAPWNVPPGWRDPTEPGAHVWVLENGTPRPVLVRPGISDGTGTELEQSPLPAGAEVIVGTVTRGEK